MAYLNHIFTANERKDYLVQGFLDVISWTGDAVVIGNTITGPYSMDTVSLTVGDDVAVLRGFHNGKNVYEYRFNYEAGVYIVCFDEKYSFTDETPFEERYENSDMFGRITVAQGIENEEYWYSNIFEFVNRPGIIDTTRPEPKPISEFFEKLSSGELFSDEEFDDDNSDE